MTQKKTLLAGIDVGGTNTRIAMVDSRDKKRPLIRKVVKTSTFDSPDKMVAVTLAAIETCCHELGQSTVNLAGIGCAIPGIVDPQKGMLIEVSNLQGWNNYPLLEVFQGHIDVPVAIENDVNAAAYGEYKLGVGQGSKSLVYFTVSTGIAAGMVMQGKLVHGAHFSAGEMGYFVPEPAFLGMDWSPNGCLEQKAAGIGIATQWAALMGGQDHPDRAREVFERAEKGDEHAQSLIQQAGAYLAQAAIALCAVVDPDVFILGGSIAEQNNTVRKSMVAHMQTMLLFPPEIKSCTIPGGAPLMGAFALAGDAADQAAEFLKM